MNFDKTLMINPLSHIEYKYFLEIRACIFDHVNKESLECNTVTGRQLENYAYNKMSNTFYYKKREADKNKYLLFNRYNDKSVFNLPFKQKISENQKYGGLKSKDKTENEENYYQPTYLATEIKTEESNFANLSKLIAKAKEINITNGLSSNSLKRTTKLSNTSIDKSFPLFQTNINCPTAINSLNNTNYNNTNNNTNTTYHNVNHNLPINNLEDIKTLQ